MNANPGTSYNNVLISSAYLMPVSGKMITAHQTRNKMLELLKETMYRRKDDERAMIVDISATTWNWDTYAIVAGTPQPVKLVFPNKDRLMEYLPLDEKGAAQKGVLVPQFDEDTDKVCESDGAKAPAMVWVPKGAVLKETEKRDDGMEEFILETLVDPNDDRLEHWEQEVLGKKWIYKWRAQLASESMRNMLRFYDLDRIVCWDLSWGIWEAVRETPRAEDDDGYPKMTLVKDGKDKIPVPSFDRTDDVDIKDIDLFYDYAQPISQNLLAESLKSVSGYYLVGGNTYTMSLFHHMWDQQNKKGGGTGHMQLLRNQLADGTIFYSGHSAVSFVFCRSSSFVSFDFVAFLIFSSLYFVSNTKGAIMSGPNILTATFKGIDAFAVVTQPYNAPYLRLPPSETPESFFAQEKNDLLKARTQMLKKMDEYGAWRGYNVVEALAFPHYDSRPRYASFPHSAETYLRATDEEGRFCQTKGSLLVGKNKDDRAEPVEVRKIREDANAKQLPCYPIANGHSMVMACGGLKVVQALSPEEEGGGTLHWDT